MSPGPPQPHIGATPDPGKHPGPQFVAPAVTGWGSAPAPMEPPVETTPETPANLTVDLRFPPPIAPSPSRRADSLTVVGTTSLGFATVALPLAFFSSANVTSMLLALCGLVFGAVGIFMTMTRVLRRGVLAFAGTCLSLIVMMMANGFAEPPPPPLSTSVPLATPALAAPVVPPPSAPEPTVPTSPFLRGTTVRMSNVYGGGEADITFVEAADAAQPRTSVPHYGMRFVSAHLRIRSIGAAPFRLEPRSKAYVLTPTGAAYAAVPALTTSGPDLPSPLDLKPGVMVDGWLTFEVPSTAHLGLLQLEDAQWRFGR